MNLIKKKIKDNKSHEEKVAQANNPEFVNVSLGNFDFSKTIMTIIMTHDYETLDPFKKKQYLAEITWYHENLIWIPLVSDTFTLKEIFKEKFKSKVFQKTTRINLFICSHGHYNDNFKYCLGKEQPSEKDIEWDIFQELLLEYLPHKPMSVFITSCYGLNAIKLIFKLLPGSKIYTMSDWFTPTVMSDFSYFCYKDPSKFFKVLIWANSSIENKGSGITVALKNNKNLVKFHYIPYSPHRKTIQKELNNYIKNDNKYCYTLYKELVIIRKNSIKQLLDISTVISPEKQLELLLSLQKNILIFFKDHEIVLPYLRSLLIASRPILLTKKESLQWHMQDLYVEKKWFKLFS